MSNKQNKNLNAIEIVTNTINKYNLISNKDTIVIGVSGGPDSMALLDILYNLKEKYDLKLVVAHVNHMIRKESEKEAIFVENACKKYEIPFEYKKINVEELAKKTKKSTETIGREERYSFFDQVLNKYSAQKIAVAHNLDDTVETTFMNLMRGSGINGLIGIKYTNGNIIRPLLDVSRNIILKYCEDNDLNPKFDKTNFEPIYTRNKIRLELLPLIRKEYNPNINDTIYRLKEILIEEQNCLNEIVEEYYKKVLKFREKDYIIIDRKIFKEISQGISKKLIIKILEDLNGSNQNIEMIHINTIDDLIKNKPSNKKFILGNKYYVENVDKTEVKFAKM